MSWCNCNHDSYFTDHLQNIDEFVTEDYQVCTQCRNSMHNDDVIRLLLKEARRLSLFVNELEHERSMNGALDTNQTYEEVKVRIEELKSIEEYLRGQTDGISMHIKNNHEIEELKKENTELKTAIDDLKTKTKKIELDRDKLTIVIDWLKCREEKREKIEIEEADKKMVEEDYLLENADKQTERFEMMDL